MEDEGKTYEAMENSRYFLSSWFDVGRILFALEYYFVGEWKGCFVGVENQEKPGGSAFDLKPKGVGFGPFRGILIISLDKEQVYIV